MKFLIMKMSIFAKESIGRLMRVVGNGELMRKECDQCRYTDIIQAEVDQVIDRLGRIQKLLDGGKQ